jgi:hypothetical protein
LGRLSGSRNSKAKSARRQHRRDALHALECLDAALRLARLGGLGLEAVDEALQLRDAVLLAAVGGGLLRQPLGAHGLEGAVVAAVAGELGLVEVQRDARDGVEELAVVADHQQRALVALQPGLEPDQRVEVEVVGRLVEQQQVARAHQRARQLQPHAPAAGEAVDRRVELRRPEAQAQHQRLGARPRVVGAGLGQVGVGLADRVAVTARLGRDDGRLDFHQARVALQHEGGGRLRGLGHLLGHLGQAPARRHREVAGVGRQTAGQQREQRGLAGAVAADQAGLSPGLRVTEAPSSTTFGPRRSTRFLRTIIVVRAGPRA